MRKKCRRFTIEKKCVHGAADGKTNEQSGKRKERGKREIHLFSLGYC